MDVNLIFGLIFAMLIMIVVLFFGFDQIGSMMGMNTQATFYNEITDFEESVSKVDSMSMGSTQKFEFTVPDTIDKICFVDKDNPESNPSRGWELTNINKKLIDDQDYNFFIYEDSDIAKGRTILHLVPDENFCISGRSTLWLENKGRYVSISK